MNKTVAASEQNSRLWTTRYGLATAVTPDNPVARSLQVYGEWAEQEIDLLSTLIEEGHNVLEFGGEYGTHALWLARAVGDSGQVHVAEPTRLLFQQMCANVAINGLTNVYTHPRWLGRSKGQNALAALPGHQAYRHAADESVSCTTIDDLGLDALHLIKMNIPGALNEVLAGAADSIRKHRPIIYARLGNIDQVELEIQTLKDLGYRCWSHTPYLFNHDNFSQHNANIFPGRVSQNVIASPVEGRFELDARLEL